MFDNSPDITACFTIDLSAWNPVVFTVDFAVFFADELSRCYFVAKSCDNPVGFTVKNSIRTTRFCPKTPSKLEAFQRMQNGEIRMFVGQAALNVNDIRLFDRRICAQFDWRALHESARGHNDLILVARHIPRHRLDVAVDRRDFLNRAAKIN